MASLAKTGMILGALITLGAVVFGLCLYFLMIQLNVELAYMALYFDDLAVDLYDSGASYDAIIVAEGQAVKFCDLYLAEMRTLDGWRYEPVCDAIYRRADLFVLCANDPTGVYCRDEQIEELEDLIEKSEPLGKELKEYWTYMSYVFSEDPYVKLRCYVGSDETDCPGVVS